MVPVKNQIAGFKKIMDGPEHYFFGYYDLMTWNRSGTKHLCNKVKFMDRLPRKEDAAELGMVDMADGGYVKIAETTAWCFQQGTMFQWNPGAPDEEVVYNIREGEEYRGVVKKYPHRDGKNPGKPVANLDPKGRYALSVNF